MTLEEKQLLLTELSARAQHKVKIYVPKAIRVNINGKIKEKGLIDTVYGVIFYNDEPKIVTSQNFSFLDKNGIYNFGGWSVERVKPYLRPLSSMTKKEKKVYDEISHHLCGEITAKTMIYFLNVHHLDYNNFIEKGLALEAPEGMYNF